MLESLHEKLDFLMRVTGTENAVFARAMRFDASYISRIRRGQRNCPSDEEFLSAAAAFFAHAIREPYQGSALMGEICPGLVWPAEEEKGKDLLFSWFEGRAMKVSPVQEALAGLRRNTDAGSGNSEKADKAAEKARRYAGTHAMASLFYGEQGKRDGVRVFLELLLKTGKPQTLLLHSDEDTMWLFEEPAFVEWWKETMQALLNNGCIIKVIHSVDRNLEEMLEAVRRWMPLYFSGRIEPYYYPHLQDKIFRRTMFVAPGQAAMISRSIRGQDCDPINILIRDAVGVNSLDAEFRAFLSQCRPLFDTFRPRDAEEREELLRAFLAEKGMLQAVFDGQQAVFFKEEFGVLILHAQIEGLAFLLKETRLVCAIEAYLQELKAPVIRDADAALAAWKALRQETEAACRDQGI